MYISVCGYNEIPDYVLLQERFVQLHVLEVQSPDSVVHSWFGEVCPLGASPHDTDGNGTCVRESKMLLSLTEHREKEDKSRHIVLFEGMVLMA